MRREFRTIMRAVLILGLAMVLLSGYSSAQTPPAKDSAEALYKRANEKMLNQDCEGAIADVTKAIQFDPRDARFYYLRGLCYAGSDFAKSLADYDQALKLKPDYVDALFGRFYLNRGRDPQKALADLKTIQRIDPSDTRAYGEEADLYLRSGAYDDAFAAGSKLVELSPKSPAGYRFQGNAMFQKGNYEQAVSLYSEALKYDAADSMALRMRADAYRRLGKFAEADADIERWKSLSQGQGGGIGMGTGRGGGVGAGSGSGTGMGKQPVSAPSKPGDYVPLKILSRPVARYTETARRNKIQGSVVLRVLFLANGTIGNISVIRALPDGLTEQAIDAARSIRFVPAKRNGVAVPDSKVISYSFDIY